MQIPVSALVPGMVLAKDLYDRSGILLMSKETSLTNDAISKLKNRQCIEVDIKELLPSQREAQEVLLIPQIAAAHDRAIGITASIMSGTENIAEVDPNLLKGMVGELKTQIDLNTNVLLNLSHIKTHDNYLFSHVVNVCIVAMILGREMKLDLSELQELGISALLHDVGMIRIDPAVYDKEAVLTAEDWTEIKRHPEYGCDLLAGSGNFSTTVLRGIGEHHERSNGGGYPHGLAGKEIHLYGKIIAVADVYDACISLRKYRKRMTPREAMQSLISLSPQFGSEVLRALVSAMALYPISTVIRLNTGEIAKVVGINHGEPFRPDIKIFFDRTGNKLEKPVRINLKDDAYTQTHIASTIEREDLAEIERKLGEDQ